MITRILILCLFWSVNAHSLKGGTNANKGIALDKKFHEVTGTQHKSEKDDEALIDIEVSKLVDKGQLSHSDFEQRTRKIREADVDAEFHKVVGVPHMSDEDDIDVANRNLDKLKRMRRSSYLDSEENTRKIMDSLRSAVNDLNEAGNKVMKSKSKTHDLLRKSQSTLEEISVLRRDGFKDYSSLTQSSRSSTPPLEPRIDFQGMLKNYHLNSNQVLPSTKISIRKSRSIEEDRSIAKEKISLNEEGSSSTRIKRSSNPRELVTLKGFTEEDYTWLAEEFNLSKEDVDAVKALSVVQFETLQRALEATSSDSNPENNYSSEDLIKVLKSARQLIPSELDAAAQGALEVGYHIGKRVDDAAGQVANLVRKHVVPNAQKLWADTVASIPNDVKEWAGDGQRIAAKRVQAVAEYASPRLQRMGKSMAQIQEQLNVAADDTYQEIVPAIVPALQAVVDELRDTLELAREVIPPMVQSFGERAEPVFINVRNVVDKNLVRPVVDFVSDESISKPLGSAYENIKPVGEAAVRNVAGGGKVVYDAVSPVVARLAESSSDVLTNKVLPAVEEYGGTAREEVERVGKSVQANARDILRGTLDSMFDGVPKILQQVSHEVHDAAKVFRGRYSSALSKMRSREEQDKTFTSNAVTSVFPPVVRAT